MDHMSRTIHLEQKNPYLVFVPVVVIPFLTPIKMSCGTNIISSVLLADLKQNRDEEIIIPLPLVID